MKNFRKYGQPPFNVAVIHGGPGAPGEMAPVARKLSSICGVLEPLQIAKTISGQVKELEIVLEEKASLPVVLVGYSWGAMLSYIFTSQHPSLVKKLILISSAVFDKKYAARIMKTRLSRFDNKGKEKLSSLMEALNNPARKDKNGLMCQIGNMLNKVDSYDPLVQKDEVLTCQYMIYQKVWDEAEILRNSGKLLELGKKIKCPVVAIHGDYDPHPFKGVSVPLSSILYEFKLILLKKCGHRPWTERYAKDKLYKILKREMNENEKSIG